MHDSNSRVEFEAFWRTHFGECAPDAPHLGEMLPERWVRFHTLPESKRYADDAREASFIAYRQKTLADDVLGEGARCWLIGHVWSRFSPPILASLPSVEMQYFGKCPNEDEFWDEPPDLIGAIVEWCHEDFAELLRLIAEDKAWGFLWVRLDNPVIFAPYDGGIDCFLRNPDNVRALKERFNVWLSAYPSGL